MLASLKELQRALSGEIGFSSSLEELSTSLYNGQLPAMWARLNPATEKMLGPWMTWFQRRFRQYKDWKEVCFSKGLGSSFLLTTDCFLAKMLQLHFPNNAGHVMSSVTFLHYQN